MTAFHTVFRFMTITALLVFVFLAAGCSAFSSKSDKPIDQFLVYDKEIVAMTRNEVLTAINECESNNTRAVVAYAKRRIHSVISEVIVDVNCAPKFRFWDGTPVGRPKD